MIQTFSRKFTLAGMVSLFAFTIVAQTDSIHLQEVVISTARSPQLYRETGRVLKTITAEEIKTLPVQSINELLETALGMDVRQRGIHGVQADVSVRGGSFEQTLVLLNGIKINDPQTGHHNMNLPVELSQIERIEILQGPGARIFGPNAFAGAINIITHSETETGINAHISGGQHSLVNTGMQASAKTGKVINSVSYNYKSLGGYMRNTDFSSNNLFISSTLKHKKTQVGLQAGYTDKGFGAQSFYTPKYPDQYEQIRVKFASLSFQTGTKTKFGFKTSYRRHHDRFELFRDSAPAWYKNHNYHMTDVYSAESNLSHRWLWFVTSVGAEYRREEILSNVLGNPLYDTLAAPGESRGFFTRGANRQIGSIFIENIFNHNRLSISKGFLTTWYSDFKQKTFFGMDASLVIIKDVSWYGSVNQSLRIPSYTELYYNGPTNIGNTDLKPEKALTYETGFKFLNPVADAHIGVFYRKGTNTIDWIKENTEQPKWQTMNHTRLNTFGTEFSGKLRMDKIVENQPLKSITANYAWLQSSKSSGDWISYYALDYLRHKLSVALHFRVIDKVTVTLQTQYQQRNGTYTAWDFETASSLGEVNYKPFTTFDVKVEYSLKSTRFFVEANNLTNVKVIDFGNIPQAGLWIQSGVSIALKRAQKSFEL